MPDGKRPTLSPRDRRWRSLAYQYVVINVICNLVWLFTNPTGSWWPRWVLLGTLIMFVRRLAGRHTMAPSVPQPLQPPLPPTPPEPPRLP